MGGSIQFFFLLLLLYPNTFQVLFLVGKVVWSLDHINGDVDDILFYQSPGQPFELDLLGVFIFLLSKSPDHEVDLLEEVIQSLSVIWSRDEVAQGMRWMRKLFGDVRIQKVQLDPVNPA